MAISSKSRTLKLRKVKANLFHDFSLNFINSQLKNNKKSGIT